MPKLPYAKLRPLFESYVDKYNTLDFLVDDPLGIPHRFSKPADLEVTAFFAAIFAWGQRKTIINKCDDLLRRMDHQPFEFVSQASENDLRNLDGFVHRTFNDADVRNLVLGLRGLYEKSGNLWSCFLPQDHEEHYGYAINRFRTDLLSMVDDPKRIQRCISDPLQGSAAKRLIMMLRWLVRQDSSGVDLGLWTQLPMEKLSCPLDVHTSRLARHFGLITRKQNDWLAVRELDTHLRILSPADPARYDFALFGMGIEGFIKDL
ncbi:MAG: TIGR02757 family protein [Flavobacteriales bacterium]|nr:MAG: TIGR02757 family protein [Flavobacteriales bacterium]